jgi:hypothetical protein
MFAGTEYTFAQMAIIWGVVSTIWGVSLLIALKIAHIKLEPLAQWIVIFLTSLTALFPAIGPFLAPLVAIYLINRMADAQLGIIICGVIVTRFIAAMVAMGVERALVSAGLLQG